MKQIILKLAIGVVCGIIFGIAVLKLFPGPGRHLDFLAIILTATNVVFALSKVKEKDMKILFTSFGFGGCWLLVYGMGAINNLVGGTLVIISTLSLVTSLVFSIAKIPS